jgi:hypothetical protein
VENNIVNDIWSWFIYSFNWCNIIYIVYVATKVTKYFRIRMIEIKDKPEKRKEMNFLQNYLLILTILPVISIVTRLPATINRVYGIFSDSQPFILFLLHDVFWTLTGFFNSLTYIYFFRSILKCEKKAIVENIIEV